MILGLSKGCRGAPFILLYLPPLLVKLIRNCIENLVIFAWLTGTNY